MSSPHLTDDELGTALGRSLRGQVDALPAVRPDFGVVEHRARQITNRRRFAGGVAIGALALLGGIGVAQLTDTEGTAEVDFVDTPEVEPTPTSPVDSYQLDDGVEASEPTVLPVFDDSFGPLIAARRDEIVMIRSDGSEEVVYSPEFGLVWGVYVVASGNVLLRDQSAGYSRALNQYALSLGQWTSGGPVVLSEDGWLVGGTVIDGASYAFVTPSGDPASSAAALELVSLDVEGQPRVTLIDRDDRIAQSISGVEVRAGRFLVERQVNGAPQFVILDADGNDLGLRTPSAEVGAGEHRVMSTQAALSPDGTTLWWVDLVLTPARGEPTVLRSMNVDTGEEGRSIDIPAELVSGSGLIDFDYDGASFLINVPTYIDALAVGPTYNQPVLVQPGADPEVRILDVEPGLYRFMLEPAPGFMPDESG